jgi:hypothetical protein
MGPQVDALKEPPSVMVILSPMRAERGGVASAKRF